MKRSIKVKFMLFFNFKDDELEAFQLPNTVKTGLLLFYVWKVPDWQPIYHCSK